MELQIKNWKRLIDFIDFSAAEMGDFGEIDRLNVKDGLKNASRKGRKEELCH
jgi:hypothetical protein